MTKVLLVGASGLVGGELLQLLQGDERVTSIIAPTRRPLAAMHKLDNPHQENLSAQLAALESPVDIVFCCLGTTRKQAGSKEAFRHVDYQLVVESGIAGRRLGAQHMLVVSAVGADAHSLFFYNKVKGEMEQALRQQNWPQLTIARPSMLTGHRSSRRLLEEISAPLFKLLPGKLKGIEGKMVAQAMLRAALAAPALGVHVLESDQLRQNGAV